MYFIILIVPIYYFLQFVFCLLFSFGKDHRMLNKILLALGVVLAISALGKKTFSGLNHNALYSSLPAICSHMIIISP